MEPVVRQKPSAFGLAVRLGPTPTLFLCKRCLLLQRLRPSNQRVGGEAEASHEGMVREIVEKRRLDSQHLVIDVGSGGGKLLRNYVDAKVPVLGIEPSRGKTLVAMERGVPTLNAWFDGALGARLASEGRRGDIVHLHRVLDRVQNLADVASGLEHVLARNGTLFIEVEYALAGLRGVEQPRISDEVVSLFSLTSLRYVFSQSKLAVMDARVIESRLCVELGWAKPETTEMTDSARQLAYEEATLELSRQDRYYHLLDAISAGASASASDPGRVSSASLG